MTFPNYAPRIDTDVQFAGTNLTWGATDDYSAQIFLDLKQETHRQILKNFILESYDNIDAIQHRVLRGNYAILVTRFTDKSATILKSTDQIPFFKFRIMKSCFYKPFISFTFRFNSPYKPAIERNLIQLFETGVTQYVMNSEIRKMYSQQWPSIFVDSEGGDDLQALGLQHLFGAFLFLSFGYGISVVGFLWEIYVWCR